MTLRGKDYCNCDHAQELREWIEVALEQATLDSTHWVLTQAIEQDKVLAEKYSREIEPCLKH